MTDKKFNDLTELSYPLIGTDGLVIARSNVLYRSQLVIPQVVMVQNTTALANDTTNQSPFSGVQFNLVANQYYTWEALLHFSISGTPASTQTKMVWGGNGVGAGNYLVLGRHSGSSGDALSSSVETRYGSVGGTTLLESANTDASRTFLVRGHLKGDADGGVADMRVGWNATPSSGGSPSILQGSWIILTPASGYSI